MRFSFEIDRSLLHENGFIKPIGKLECEEVVEHHGDISVHRWEIYSIVVDDRGTRPTNKELGALWPELTEPMRFDISFDVGHQTVFFTDVQAQVSFTPETFTGIGYGIPEIRSHR